MKSTKDFRSQDAAADTLRRASKLEPNRKSGKDKHHIYKDIDPEDDEDYELNSLRPRESVLDYMDDQEDDQ
ncbi:MAG: hypothetical protein RR931_01980 [Mucinivorans sp.]